MYVGVSDPERRFERDSMEYEAPEVVAYRLTEDFTQRLLNPKSDFDPAGVAPCQGFLKSNTVMQLTERPEGLIASAGNKLMVRGRVLTTLQALNPRFRDGAAIYLEGKRLVQWHQLEADSEIECLDSSWRQELVCVSCGCPTVSTLGPYFGRPVTSNVVGYDATQWGKYGKERELIASPSVAELLEKQFGVSARFGLFPVFDINGATAATVRGIYQRLAPLLGEHPRWKVLRDSYCAEGSQKISAHVPRDENQCEDGA